jgi:hypothetical protein
MQSSNLKKKGITMKKILVIVLMLFITSSSYGCLIRYVINKTQHCSIIFGPGVIIPGMSSRSPHLVPPALAGQEQQVDTKGSLSVGDELTFAVEEKTPLSVICKGYRIISNDQKKEIILQRKDVCGQGQDYETLSKETMNSDRCFIDIRLEDNVNGLSITAVGEEELMDFKTISPSVKAKN